MIKTEEPQNLSGSRKKDTTPVGFFFKQRD
jgi:hypothetical protein